MGADPLLLDNWGNSALAWAAHEGALEVCRLLLSAGANINAYFQMPRTLHIPRVSLLLLSINLTSLSHNRDRQGGGGETTVAYKSAGRTREIVRWNPRNRKCVAW
jgi:ankyrin repeat protein